MKKSIIIISALMSCFLLTACGSQSSSSKESSSTAAQSSTAKSSSKKSSHSDSQIQKASSSSDSSTTASSTAKTAKVDDKTTGVMLALLVEPDCFKEYIGNDFFPSQIWKKTTMSPRVKKMRSTAMLASWEARPTIWIRINSLQSARQLIWRAFWVRKKPWPS